MTKSDKMQFDKIRHINASIGGKTYPQVMLKMVIKTKIFLYGDKHAKGQLSE